MVRRSSSIIAFHCAIQPMVRPIANITGNMLFGIPSAFIVTPL
jgi:hypothetical protein